MRIRTIVAALTLVGISILAAPASGQAPDPWIGTWKLNVDKSTYSPGPAPKSSTITTMAAAGGFHQTTDTVPATGAAQKWEVMATLDGKDCAVKGNNPNSDTQSYKRIDSRTYEVSARKGGKATLTSRVSISADGKTRTTTQGGTDAQGQKVNNTLVFERQ